MYKQSVLLFVLSAAFLVSRAADFSVNVGQSGLTYTPDHVSGVLPGDTVTFHFYPSTHTATQGSFAFPCSKLDGGLDSGSRPGVAGGTDTYRITVNNTHPIWIYCSTPGHCSAGMVFAINAVSDAQLAQYKANAANGNGATATSFGSDWSTPTYPSPTTTVTTTVTIGGAATPITYAPLPGDIAVTPNAQPVEHPVDVGLNGLTFTPSIVQAAVGDVIVFSFHPQNHSVTQSTFRNPCVPSGFDSGLTPVANGVAPTQFRLTINDTNPVWAYCKQPVGNHCKTGMVFAVNPNEEGANTFEAFQELAKRTNGTASPSSTTSSSGGNGGNGGNGYGYSGSALSTVHIMPLFLASLVFVGFGILLM